jgi:hypothetical protein
MVGRSRIGAISSVVIKDRDDDPVAPVVVVAMRYRAKYVISRGRLSGRERALSLCLRLSSLGLFLVARGSFKVQPVILPRGTP